MEPRCKSPTSIKFQGVDYHAFSNRMVKLISIQ
jgi:hypothetical protein